MCEREEEAEYYRLQLEDLQKKASETIRNLEVQNEQLRRQSEEDQEILKGLQEFRLNAEVVRDSLEVQVRQLKRDLQEAKELSNICVVCLENAPTYMWIACGHFGVCSICEQEMQANKPPNQRDLACPICSRRSVVIRVYASGAP